MSIKKSRCCIISLIVTCLIVFISVPKISVNAEITETSLKLVCKTDEVILSGMDWNLYKVSSTKENDVYKLEDDFSGYKVSLKDLSTTSTMLDVANTLENYAVLDKISPVSSSSTDENGVVYFGDLEKGLYLLSGKSVIIDDKKYIPSAMLVEVEENKQTAFELVAYPKFTSKTISQNSIKYTVRKMWLNDDDDLENRPNDIIVELYMNDELAETVHLNDSNNWEYSWTSTNIVDWRVKEVSVPENYMVIYRNDEVIYLVVNIHASDDDNTHNATSSDTHSEITTTNMSGSNISQTTTTDMTGSNISQTTTTLVSNSNTLTASNSTTSAISNTNLTSTTTITDDKGNTNDITDITDTSNTVVTTTVPNSSSNNDKNNISSVGSNSSNINNANNNNTTVDKLTQTGQVWLPVPILTLCGIVLISIGLQLKSKK